MIAQALVDGVLTGAIVALGAIAVSFSLAILRFANFAFGDLLTVGAYAALFVTVMSAVPGAAPPGPFSFGWGMAAAIMRFMSDDELHAQFSVEASRSVRGYSSADMARQVLEVYRQVLDAKLPPSLSPLSTPVERGRG